jgi:hypothetical protein
MAAEKPTDQVAIRLSTNGQVSIVSRAAFEKVWERKGYKLAPKGDQPTEPATVAEAPSTKKA